MTKESELNVDCANAQQKDPGHMYSDLPEAKVNTEVVLLEKYQAFSAEIVRLSLLGVVVFGFLYKEVFAKAAFCDMAFELPAYLVWIAISSIVVFSLATVLALTFRYLSTEALRYYVAGLRYQEEEKNEKKMVKMCLAKRDDKLNQAYMFKLSAVVAFGLGAAMLGVFVAMLLYEIWVNT